VGTIITSEEITSSDSNGDGYNDIGWKIEIEPGTCTVINQTGGLPGEDKLCALGNFRH